MSSNPTPPDAHPPDARRPDERPPDALADLIADVAAGDASESDAASIRALARSDARVAALLADAERLERALRGDILLALPLGLVARVLTRVESELRTDSSTTDSDPIQSWRATRVDGRPRLLRRAAMAAAALLALGAGVGGLFAATAGDGFGVLGEAEVASTRDGARPLGVAPVVSARAFLDLADAARATAPVSARSLAGVSDQVPGSPGALAAGSLVLFGAAVLGARRRGGGRRKGPMSDTGALDGPDAGPGRTT